jgi:type IV secretory pathway TraG/TraD family ATPase VirD4
MNWIEQLLWALLSPVHLSYRVVADMIWPVFFAWWAAPLIEALKSRWWHKAASVHGDAAFATQSDLRRAGRFKPQGFMSGVLGWPVYLDLETSAIVFGSRGAGKTQTFIANLKAMKDREARPDLIVSDPVGDIEKAVSDDLLKLGYGTVRLDLTDLVNSNRYDPLSFLNSDLRFDYARDVMAICELMLPSDVRENDAGLHFLESARAMLQSMIMHRRITVTPYILR